jgi:hypothetical protein
LAEASRKLSSVQESSGARSSAELNVENREANYWTTSTPSNIWHLNAFVAVYSLLALLIPSLTNIAVSAGDGDGASLLLIWFYPFFCLEGVLVPFLAVGQFIPQISLIRQSTESRRPRLHLLSILAIDSVLYICLGAANMALLLRCTWHDNYFGVFYLFGIVFLTTFLVGNYAIVGIGHIILLILYARKTPVALETDTTSFPAEGCEGPELDRSGDGETQPLLGNARRQ